MFAAILVLLVLPLVDSSNLRGLTYKPMSKLFFWIFVANFLTLMVLGAKHVEAPYIVLGQIATFIYFTYFLFLVPSTSTLENLFGATSSGSADRKAI
jgi:ubiquinol-cytochrome c reductase cytochrome b subunit